MRASRQLKKSAGAKGRRPLPARSTRDALIAAAAKLFNTVGYDGTDSNRIARAAGYSPGTFYTHFADKLAIFLEVYRSWVSDEMAAIEAVLSSSEDPHALSARLAAVILEHHRKWRIFRASLRALYATDPNVHAARLAERNRQMENIARRFHAQGQPAPSRARMLASLLFVEILCDAAADGDVEALGVEEADILRILAAALHMPQPETGARAK